jgi:hypothetical protein
MAGENVELVRRMYEATPGLDPDPAADREFLDRMFRDFFDADLIWRLPAEYPAHERQEALAGAAGEVEQGVAGEAGKAS